MNEAPRAFRLRRAGAAIELADGGLRRPRALGLGAAVIPYRDVLHVAAGARGVRIATRRGSLGFRRADFAEPDAHRALARELRACVARLPDGFARLERIARLDRLQSRSAPPRVAAGLALACGLAFALQIAAPELAYSGEFSALLVRLGEPWRLVTANFLHASVGHLALNVLGLALLGSLAERALGSLGAGAVAALSGLGATAASYAAGYEHALGASGVVYGIAGALIWLEVFAPASLPAGWRIPRGLFVSLVALESAVLLALPGIAHAAHAGGFAAGALGAAAVGPRLASEGRSRPALAALCGLALAVALLSAAAWARSAVAPDTEAIARRGEALLAEDEAPAAFLNNEAWRIATAREPGERALSVAARLAMRAAEATRWSDPQVLDTLAEVRFAQGRAELALELADQAIALAPEEPYYREQRRRFAGERARDDRPDPPSAPGAGGGPSPERPAPPRRDAPAADPPGVRV
jgi:membrane associated rhomboid family serine protease